MGAFAIVCSTIILLVLISWGMYYTLNKCDHKYGPPENGIQKCKHCGIIRYVECNHFWERIDSATIGSLMVNVLQCKKC